MYLELAYPIFQFAPAKWQKELVEARALLFVVPILSSFTFFTSIDYYGLGAAFLVVLALVIGVMALEGYIVSLTKKRLINELRLINEFIKFTQPLPPPDS